MPIKLNLLNTALTAASLAVSGVTIATLSAASASNFTVTTWPASPYVGEGFGWRIEGAGGHTGITAGRETQDVALSVDPGETGSYRLSDASYNAIKGPVGGHAFKSAGAQTLTLSSWSFGNPMRTQDFNVTVVDPDAETWEQVYWIDLSASPSTANMPANDATNTRITTAAAFDALRQTYNSGGKYRLRFRSGVTHVHVASNVHRTSAAVMYCDTFDGTAMAIHDYTAKTSGSVFGLELTGCRFIWLNQSVIGPYDAAEGAGGEITFVTNWDANQDGLAVSLTSSDFSGLREALAFGSTALTYRGNLPVVFDCGISKWQNYALFLGSCDRVVIRGSRIVQSPIAGTADAQPQPPLDWPDHGPMRFSHSNLWGISGNVLGSCNGWSGAVGLANGIWQPVLRIYTEDDDTNTTGCLGCVTDNEMMGGFGIEFGRQNPNQGLSYASTLLVEGNRFYFGAQRGIAVQAHQGGVLMQNNTVVRHPLQSGSNGWNYILLRQSDRALPGVVANAAWEQPSELRFNTYVSNLVAPFIDGSAGNILASVIDADLRNPSSDGNIDGAVRVVEHNQLSGDNHANSGSLIAASAFSAGDDMRPITGGAAVDAQTSGPPLDINDNVRTNPTNAGAHHAAGSNVTPPVISNSIAPAIVASSTRTNTLIMSDEGTWVNVPKDTIPHVAALFFEAQWQRDGVDIADPDGKYKTYEHGGTAGTYRLIVTYAQNDGTRVSATSNSIVV